MQVVVSSLNRVIDDARAGRTVFYDIYTDTQKESEPSRKETGLSFFRGRPGAPFAVIAPGGDFAYVGSLHEGFPYAVEIGNRGYNAFVLKYRAGHGEAIATDDLAGALSYIFRHAAALGITTTDYSLWGSSAGARMAAAVGSYGAARYGGSSLPKPSALVLLYTGHSDVASTEPPTFVAVGERDGIAPPAAMERRVAALRTQGTEVEYRKYPGVAHGFGVGVGTSVVGEDHLVMITAAAGRGRTAKGGSVNGLDPKSGTVLWTYTDWQCILPVPQAVDGGQGRVLITGAYGAGTVMLNVDTSATPVGRAVHLRAAHFCSPDVCQVHPGGEGSPPRSGCRC